MLSLLVLNQPCLTVLMCHSSSLVFHTKLYITLQIESFHHMSIVQNLSLNQYGTNYSTSLFIHQRNVSFNKISEFLWRFILLTYVLLKNLEQCLHIGNTTEVFIIVVIVISFTHILLGYRKYFTNGCCGFQYDLLGILYFLIFRSCLLYF